MLAFVFNYLFWCCLHLTLISRVPPPQLLKDGRRSSSNHLVVNVSKYMRQTAHLHSFAPLCSCLWNYISETVAFHSSLYGFRVAATAVSCRLTSLIVISSASAKPLHTYSTFPQASLSLVSSLFILFFVANRCTQNDPTFSMITFYPLLSCSFVILGLVYKDHRNQAKIA